MKKLSEYLLLWTLGGSFYYTFELFFRGFSHWSMFVLGGVCMVFCAQQGKWTRWRAPLWKQVGWCVIFVTACEFTLLSGWLLHFLYGEEAPHFHVL